MYTAFDSQSNATETKVWSKEDVWSKKISFTK